MATSGAGGESTDTPQDGVAMGEAGSSHSFTVGNASESVLEFPVTLHILMMILGLNWRLKNYHVEVKNVSDYSMTNLLADLATKTKWGTCQEPTFWYWDIEKKGLQCVVTDADLKLVFQKFEASKIVTFVVELIIKPAYKSSMTLEQKLEKLPVQRNPVVAPETSSSAESDEESGGNEENVDPSWMDDEDIFMDDHEVFVSLGLRAEDEAARLNLKQDGLGSDAGNAQIPVDDEAENEPRFAIDKEHPKIKKGEAFTSMVDFRMALRQYAIQKEDCKQTLEAFCQQ